MGFLKPKADAPTYTLPATPAEPAPPLTFGETAPTKKSPGSKATPSFIGTPAPQASNMGGKTLLGS